jgi:hypothetical protein
MLLLQQNGFLSVLPKIATSPIAILAYVIVVLAWLYLGAKIKRHAQLLKALPALPERDRKAAIEAEIGTVRLKEGFSPEQYIRSRIHHYTFWGVLAFLGVAALIILTALSRHGSPQAPEVSLSSFAERREDELDSIRAVFATEDSLRNRAVSWTSRSETTLEYRSSNVGDTLIITPLLGYLDDLKKGDVVTSVGGFGWEFPRVAVTIVNNTRNTIAITEARMLIDTVELSPEPLLRVYAPLENSVGKFFLINDGWGPARDVRLEYAIRRVRECNESSSITHVLQIRELNNDAVVDITDLLPSDLQDARSACVVGMIQYSGTDRDTLRFAVVVPLEIEMVSYLRLNPSYEYDAFVDVSQIGSPITLPAHHALRPGDVDMFTVRIGTPQSARMRLRFSFRTAGGQILDGGSVRLDVLVPRTDARWVERTELPRK